jgi:type II secretory pathway pseudopilin PulG
MNRQANGANPGCGHLTGLLIAAPRTTERGQSRSAFTFAEVLAAMVFLAILIPVVMEGLTLANRAAVVAERTAIAAQLGENRLQELLFNRLWVSAPARGDFGPDWSGYQYELIRGNWPVDRMIQLTVRVTFEVQGRQHEIRLDTLVDDSA